MLQNFQQNNCEISGLGMVMGLLLCLLFLGERETMLLLINQLRESSINIEQQLIRNYDY